MTGNLIKILPENVANQIAAGEVVQRPASMVKELMENAVDAGARSVSVVVRDGGKTVVQIIDDGCGMTADDAKVCFARHATSKIRESKDIFALKTFGFRGEALASIASVSEVELRTRREDDEVGALVTINGGTDSDAQIESISCPKGTQITVRNLFFNIPARRKFIKSDATETKQIISEFQRVALCHPDIAFTLVADDKTLFTLSPGGLKQRITAIVGRKTGEKLLDVELDSPIVKIDGYVGLPATAKKGAGEQFFFVNGRYLRSPYLQKSVVSGYNKMLPYGYTPSYFIYITVDPARIDVNIHPQKTEIKFEDEQALWQILSSGVGRSLGRHNVVPLLDFENTTPGLEIPIYENSPRGGRSGGATSGGGISMPTPPTAFANDDYNPFQSYDSTDWDTPATSRSEDGIAGLGFGQAEGVDPEQVPFTEMLPSSLTTTDIESSLSSSDSEAAEQQVLPIAGDGVGGASRSLVFGGGKYVVTTTADGVVIIDRVRARLRITYEEFLRRMENDFSVVGQRELFPETIELSSADHFMLMANSSELLAMGFDIRDMGGGTVVVSGLPIEMGESMTSAGAVEELLAQIKGEGGSLRDNHREKLAAAMARSCCAPMVAAGKASGMSAMTSMEADALVRQLFACEEPNYAPDGRPVMSIVSVTELEKRMKR